MVHLKNTHTFNVTCSNAPCEKDTEKTHKLSSQLDRSKHFIPDCCLLVISAADLVT